MIRVILAALVLGLTAACQTTVNPSESYYTSSEAMRSASVQRCRVLEVREISIGAQDPRRSYGYGQVVGQPEEQIGTVLGAALGAAVGSQIGGGSGRVLATAIATSAGAAAGRAQGSRMSQKRMTQMGLEYSILTAQGREEVIVQHFNQGDRIVPAGSTCRIAGSGVGKRVLPGEHLPSSIGRPKQTTFSN